MLRWYPIKPVPIRGVNRRRNTLPTLITYNIARARPSPWRGANINVARPRAQAHWLAASLRWCHSDSTSRGWHRTKSGSMDLIAAQAHSSASTQTHVVVLRERDSRTWACGTLLLSRQHGRLQQVVLSRLPSRVWNVYRLRRPPTVRGFPEHWQTACT